MPAFSAADTFGGESLTSPSSREPADHLLLNVVFGRRDAAGEPPSDLLERAVFDPVQLLRRLRDASRSPRSSQTAANRCTRSPDDTTSTPALSDELDRAGVDARDVRDRAFGRVLHRHALQSRPAVAQAVIELFAAGIPLGRARKVCERVALDGVDEPARLAGGGNQVVPAPAWRGDRPDARPR